MREYTIDVRAYDHVSTTKVVAEDAHEAIRKACEKYRIEVTIRSSREVDEQRGS